MSDRNTALMTLMATIFEHDEAGRTVPCVRPTIGHWWLSEDAEQVAAAVTGCQSCPALDACRAYVESYPEVAGVWAGAQRPIDRRRKGVL